MKYFLLILGIFLCSCNKPQKDLENNSSDTLNYEQLGAEITAQAQSAILLQLSKAIQNKGIDGAIEYCNANISLIIDSLSQTHQCKIRRTSLKLRNPANAPKNDDEVFILQKFHESYSQSKKIDNKLVERDGKAIYYKPIVIMMETCLKCHGKPDVHVSSNTLKKIQKLYPNDQAINFELHDFRGMWIVEFDK